MADGALEPVAGRAAVGAVCLHRRGGGRFRRERRERYANLAGARELNPLLAYLRGLGVVPEPVSLDTPAERLLADYRDYLVRERAW
jgi:hypothetical protein